MSEHGFLSPNPALLELEKLKPRPGLAHELGAGAPCSNCKERCPGFQLHFWRKVCMNCRCGKAEHNVVEKSDPGFYFVGRLFDRPLRTKEEELVFMYGDVFQDEFDQQKAGVELKLDWVPQGVSMNVAAKYLKSIPPEYLSIEGSDGAQRRLKQLEKQFPIHDVEPTNCHDLTSTEILTMQTYIDSVRKDIAGQGLVQEIGGYTSPPLPDRALPHHSPAGERGEFIQAWTGEQEETYQNLPPPLPTSAPPGRGSELDELSGRLDQIHFGKDASNTSASTISGTFHARPYQPNGPVTRVSGSTGSSIASASPSPPHPASPNHLESSDLSNPSAALFRNMGSSTYNPAVSSPYNPGSGVSGRSSYATQTEQASADRRRNNSSLSTQTQGVGVASQYHDRPSGQQYQQNDRLPGNERSVSGQGFDPSHIYAAPEKKIGSAARLSQFPNQTRQSADGSVDKQRRPNGVVRGADARGRNSDKEARWACSGCGEGMVPGEVAIFAERAGQDKCWHPSCFSCSSCGELLEDLLYFYSKGKLFCGRDFAEMMAIPRCGACDELIFAAEYTGAENLFWHLKHFCCYLCDTPLAGHKYIPVNSQPHCLTCWQNNHGKICTTCSTYISPEEQRVTLDQDHWHATDNCFHCGVCRISLLGGKMTRRGGTLLCSSACAAKLNDRQQPLEPSGRRQQPSEPSGRHQQPSEPSGRHKQPTEPAVSRSTSGNQHPRNFNQNPPNVNHIQSSWRMDSPPLAPPVGSSLPRVPQPGAARVPSHNSGGKLEPWQPLLHANKIQGVHHRQQQNQQHGLHHQSQHHQLGQHQQIHRGYEYERAQNARIEGKRSPGRHVQFAAEAPNGRRPLDSEDDISPYHSRDSSYSTIV